MQPLGWKSTKKEHERNDNILTSAVEEHDYHVVESNGRDTVDCEGVYSVASEGAGCEGVYSEGAGCEGVCSDYEIPRDSKVWLCESDYSTLKH